MKKILMLGCNSGSMEMLEAAKERGYYTIVTGYDPVETSSAKQYADEHWSIDTADLDRLEEQCHKTGVDAVITGISEFNIRQMLQLCQRLELPTYADPAVWNRLAQKHEFKKLCREHGIPVAKDYVSNFHPTEEELRQIRYPVVVKPVDQAANQGISFCGNRKELEDAIVYARQFTRNENLVVEQRLMGIEYVAYYALAEGESVLLMIMPGWTEPGYPSNCYGFGYNVSTQQYREKVDGKVRQMLKDAGCRDGFCFVQFILEPDGNFYALEMGYRLSGDMMARPMRQCIPFNAYHWLLDLAVGQKHTVAQLPKMAGELAGKVGSYILWSKSAGVVQRIEGVEELLQIPHMNLQMMAKVGQPFQQYRYMAIISYPAKDYEEMMHILKTINETLKVYDQDGSNVLIYYTDYPTIEKYRGEK